MKLAQTLAPTSTSPTSSRSTSRLLPRLLTQEKLEQGGRLRILDFGRASSQSLQFFGQYPCKLHVLEAAPTLLAWRQQLTGEETDADLHQQVQALFPTLSGEQFDLILLWDTFNYVPARALEALCWLLNTQAAQHCAGHGFMLHKKTVAQQLRHCGVVDENTIEVSRQDSCELYVHTRKFVTHALSPINIEHGILHSDGWLEYIFRKHDAPAVKG